MGTLSLCILLGILLPLCACRQQITSLKYQCSMEYYQWDRFKIYCSCEDDSVVKTALSVNGENLPHREYDESLPRAVVLEHPLTAFSLKTLFESGTTISVTSNDPTSLQTPFGKGGGYFRIGVRDAITIKRSRNGKLGSLSYTVNDEPPESSAGPEESEVTTIPFTHEGLKVGENSITLHVVNTIVIITLTFPVEIYPSLPQYVPTISCESSFCDKRLVQSVQCSVHPNDLVLTCYYDGQEGPSEPCDQEFEIDVTRYVPGYHHVEIVATDPATGTSVKDTVSFYSPTSGDEYSCDLNFTPDHFGVLCTAKYDQVSHLTYTINGRTFEKNEDSASHPVDINARLLNNYFTVDYVFQSSVTLSVFDDQLTNIDLPSVPHGLLRPSDRVTVSCEVETEDEIEITCHSNPLGWSSISYSINDGHLTELDCSRFSVEIEIPFTDRSLKLGENTISVIFQDIAGVSVCLTIPVVLNSAERELELSCEATLYKERPILSVECSATIDPVTLACYYDDQRGTSEPCGHEFKIDVTEYNPGPHKVRIIAYDPVTGSSSEEIIPFYTPSTPRDLEVCFSSYTPLVKGGRLYAEFRANRRVRLYCHLVGTGILYSTPEYDEEDCSGGVFEKDDLVPGTYTLTVTARDTRGDLQEEAVIETEFFVHSSVPSDSFCSVHLINCGWVLEGGTLTVEFAGTGLASRDCSQFECCLDEVCDTGSSPFHKTGISPGKHHVEIKPTDCQNNYFSFRRTFTVENEY